MLAFPKEDLPYIVDTDASDYGIGGVLSQSIEGAEHVRSTEMRMACRAALNAREGRARPPRTHIRQILTNHMHIAAGAHH